MPNNTHNESRSARPHISRNVIIIAFVALFSGWGQDLVAPALPAFMVLLGFNHAGIGLVDGLLQSATSIFRFVSGVLSDRYRNRKTFVFLGYALSSVTRPLLAFASSLPFIAGLRLLDGVGKGTKDAPRDALVADSSSDGTHGRAFGFHRFIDTAGSVIGPLMATGVLFLLTPSLFAYRVVFALAAIPGIIALALIWFGVREPEKKTFKIKRLREPFPWAFWLFTAGTAVAMLTKINDALFLVRAQDIGIPPTWIPLLFAGFTLIYAVLSYPIGIWSDRIGKLPLITAGWLVMAFVELGFAYESSIVTALILFAFFGLFYALTEGSGRAFIADVVPLEQRGSAYAVFHTIVGLSVIVGGYTLGHVWDVMSSGTAFKLSAMGSFVGFAILLVMLVLQRRKSKA